MGARCAQRAAPLQAMADDPARFDGVTTLGVHEHVRHHVDEAGRGSAGQPLRSVLRQALVIGHQ